jgi:hypothetical protein
MIDLQVVPTWIVGIVMLCTAYIWLVTIKHKVRMNSKVIAYTLAMWGLMYGLAGFSDVSAEHIAHRLAMSRVIIIMICLSQSLPLLVSYFRSKRRGD